MFTIFCTYLSKVETLCAATLTYFIVVELQMTNALARLLVFVFHIKKKSNCCDGENFLLPQLFSVLFICFSCLSFCCAFWIALPLFLWQFIIRIADWLTKIIERGKRKVFLLVAGRARVIQTFLNIFSLIYAPTAQERGGKNFVAQEKLLYAAITGADRLTFNLVNNLSNAGCGAQDVGQVVWPRMRPSAKLPWNILRVQLLCFTFKKLQKRKKRKYFIPIKLSCGNSQRKYEKFHQPSNRNKNKLCTRKTNFN